jgi:SNF2 family DNA or RNA helicase
MAVTEKDLMRIAGWECIKNAKLLLAGDSVKTVKFNKRDSFPLIVTGLVIDKRRKFVCGLKFNDLDDVENLCRCPESAKDGKVCKHSIALLLYDIHHSQVDLSKLEDLDECKYRSGLNEEYSFCPVIELQHQRFKNDLKFNLSFKKHDNLSFLNETTIQKRLFKNKTTSDQRISEEKIYSVGANILASLFESLEFGYIELRFSENTKKLILTDAPAKVPIVVSCLNEQDLEIRRHPLPEHFLFGSSDSSWLINSLSLVAMPIVIDESINIYESDLLELFKNFENKVCLRIDLKSFKSQIDTIRKYFRIDFSNTVFDREILFSNDPDIKLSVEGSLNNLIVITSFSYRDSLEFNLPVENNFLDALSIDNKFEGEYSSNTNGVDTLVRQYKCILSGNAEILNFHSSKLTELLGHSKIEVELGERFYALTKDIDLIQPKAILKKSGSDWFEFGMEFISPAGIRLNEREIRELISRGTPSIKKKDGKNVVIDLMASSDLFNSLELSTTDQTVSGDLVIRQVHGREAIFIKENLAKFGLSFKDNHSLIDDCLFKRFSGELKDYQKIGLQWMSERLAMNSGFILADEMGLGKTIQILALLSSIDVNNIPSLIICPTSLFHNWSKEIKKFLPSFKFIVHHGPNRGDLSHSITDNDIVITTYGTLISDVDDLSKIKFSIVVADEASFFKNPLTKTAKSIQLLSSSYKIAVTGTPIENNIEDLWSLMNIVNPNYLGSRMNFINSYGSSNATDSTLDNLKKKVSPFILRRIKSDVLKELPDKVEKIIYCELNEKERIIYNNLLVQGKDLIGSFFDSKQSQNDNMEVLTLLLRLRQTCCDLNLFSDPVDNKFVSSKISLLEPIIKNAINHGGKIIVFSQFVKMLNTIERHLDSMDISSFLLHGGILSKERDRLVNSFQDPNNNTPVFLVSLKAGGYGLNLTAADTVIHFDPWWNPSVENQATDRVHRIGQSKVVNCFKLIASNTVEEKILSLQQEKMNLIDMSIDEDRPVMSGLTKDDLNFVLS